MMIDKFLERSVTYGKPEASVTQRFIGSPSILITLPLHSTGQCWTIMRGLIIVVCVAVVVAVVVATQQQELKEHYDHLAKVAEFKCHQPKPRVISVHVLFPEKYTQHKAVFPDVTVLHICDETVGCCPYNHICRPKHTHLVSLPFKVTFLEPMGEYVKGSWVIDYHPFVNHTECECVHVCVPNTDKPKSSNSMVSAIKNMASSIWNRIKPKKGE